MVRRWSFGAGAVASATLIAALLTSCGAATNDAVDDQTSAAPTNTPSSVSIPGFNLPQVVAASADGKLLYVAQNDGTVVKVNTPAYTAAGSWNSGITVPLGLALSPDGGTIYMSNRTAGTVARKNAATGANSGSWSTGSGTAPTGIGLSPDGSTIYVPQNASAGLGADKLTVRTAASGGLLQTWTFPGGSRPRAVVISPDGSKAYVSLEGGNRISVRNTSDGAEVASWPLAGTDFTTPGYMALSKKGDHLYVGAVSPTGVLVLNTNDGSTEGKWTSGFASAFGVAAANCGQTVFVANSTDPGSVLAVAQPNQCIAAPTVAEVSPKSGSSLGGTPVTIEGKGFVQGATASFGGSNCTSLQFISVSQLKCTTTAHAVGAVNVVVTNPDTQSGTLTNGYTYVTPSPTNQVPSAPQKVTATSPAKKTIKVTWQAPASAGSSPVTSYTATAIQKDTKERGTCTANGTTFTCTMTGVNGGKQFDVTVTATNASGTGPESSPPVVVTTK